MIENIKLSKYQKNQKINFFQKYQWNWVVVFSKKWTKLLSLYLDPIRKKRKRTQINKVRNERGEITIDFTEITIDILEKAMATHYSTLAWKISWTEEPGRLQYMGSLAVRHNWATSLSHIGEGNGNPLQCSCLENPRDGEAWWAATYGVAQNWTWLKWLNSSSSNWYIQNSAAFIYSHNEKAKKKKNHLKLHQKE